MTYTMPSFASMHQAAGKIGLWESLVGRPMNSAIADTIGHTLRYFMLATPRTGVRATTEGWVNALARGDARGALAAKALKDGAQLNPEVEYIHKGFIDKNTPLYFAAEKGELDLVRLFVEHGASVKPDGVATMMKRAS